MIENKRGSPTHETVPSVISTGVLSIGLVPNNKDKTYVTLTPIKSL